MVKRMSPAGLSSPTRGRTVRGVQQCHMGAASFGPHHGRFCGIFFVCLAFLGYCAAGEYPLQLKNLYVSHGVLEPMFEPAIRNYILKLSYPYSSLTITPEIVDSSEYQEEGRNWPLVEVLWNGKSSMGPQSTSVPVRSEAELPGDGGSLQAEITVQNPAKPRDKEQYNVKVVQDLSNSEPHLGLREITLTDYRGRDIEIQKDSSPDSLLAFIDPSETSVKLSVLCVEGNSVTVDGGFVSNGGAIGITRELWHHKQVVQVECRLRGGLVADSKYSRVYVLTLLADVPYDEIAPPKLVVDGVGRECEFVKKHEKYLCPTPNSHSLGLTRIVSYFEPSIRYTVESTSGLKSDGAPSIQVRLINSLPSVPFSYASNLQIVGWAGRYSRTWPLEFSGMTLMAWMSGLGWFLTLSLLTLLLTLMTVLAFSNVFGLGSPFGAAAIAVNSTFLLQYFCFAATFLRDQGSLLGIVQLIKWVTLFWPLPWEVSWRDLGYSSASGAVHDGGPTGVIGNTLDVHNAMGCIFWSTLMLLFTMAFRFFVAMKLTASPKHTYPHRMRFGHWECRAIHVLLFPVVTASCMIMSAPGAFTKDSQTSLLWEIIAVLAFLTCISWITSVYVIVKRAVRQEEVTWVWNTGTRHGQLEDEEGFWCDVLCDQLNTHAVNRGVLPSAILPWRWTSTVADIEPVVILSDRRRSRHVNEYGSSGSSHSTALLDSIDYAPLGGASTEVEIKRTRLPGLLCPGQKMIAGLMHYDWIDVLFTYQGLTRFHSQVVADTHHPYSFPLTVTLAQLQGPFTAGRYCFFFDGVRVPFIKIEDSIFRSVVGLCVGICLALQLRSTQPVAEGIFIALAVCYGFVGFGSLASLIYTSLTMPFTRRVENVLLFLVLGVLALCSWSFMGYAIAKTAPSTFADMCMWLCAVACVILGVYSCLVIFSLIVAMTCPPLEETRFLQRLANCTLTIADHADGWAVDLPAFSRHHTRAVKAVCQYLLPSKPPTRHETLKPKLLVSLIPTDEEPALEFSVVDIKRSIDSGTSLRVPVACIFAPSSSYLGYKSENVFPKDDFRAVISDFLLREPLTKTCANDLARHIVRVVEKHKQSAKKLTLSLTIIPPSSNTMVFEEEQSSRSSVSASSSFFSTGGSTTRNTSTTHSTSKYRESHSATTSRNESVEMTRRSRR